jgi:hypothetical protein
VRLTEDIVRRLSAKPGDIAAILVGAVLLGLTVFAAVAYTGWRTRPNFGFGPEWECTYAGQGDPVCIRRQGSEQ